MRWKSKSWILIGVLLAVGTATGVAQVATTQVADTVYHADGTPAAGSLVISWPAFTTSAGNAIPSGNTSAEIGSGGTLSVNLVPNSGSTPIGSYYTVVYHLDDGSVTRQYWVVPVSSSAVKISAIESTVLPTSVAMQTVSKSYVDTAIAAAISGHPLDSSPYVLKAGDTMTGPLVLPADPASANQAADDELALMRAHDLTSAQIGFRRGLQASYRGLRVQEFAEDPELCFRTTGECCFDIESVERRLTEAKAPLETRRGGALRIWLPPLPGKEYLLAVDPAGGGPEGDYAALQVIDLASGVQCAELQQRIGTRELARVTAELAVEYGRALVAIERNNYGTAVIAYLDAVEKYPLVYGQNGLAGWLTSTGSKPGMVDRMGVLLVESPRYFLSRILLEECRTFVSFPGGRSGAANGAHDDCLMAMALAQAVRAEWLQNGSRHARTG